MLESDLVFEHQTPLCGDFLARLQTGKNLDEMVAHYSSFDVSLLEALGSFDEN